MVRNALFPFIPKSTNMDFYKQYYLNDGMLILDLTESFNTENA